MPNESSGVARCMPLHAVAAMLHKDIHGTRPDRNNLWRSMRSNLYCKFRSEVAKQPGVSHAYTGSIATEGAHFASLVRESGYQDIS
jgi:hypothetical protein